MSLGLEAQPALTRDAFVESPANQQAVDTLDAWPDGLTNVVAVCGPRLSGKTHLLTAWAERTGAVLLDGESAALAQMADLEGRLVALDEADRVDDETLFHLINLAGGEGAGLLLASRQPPASWPTDLPDLRSRLNAIRVVGLAEPDDALLKGMLTRFFGQNSVRPSPELLEYLVRRIERSAPAARAVVRRLIEAAAPQNRPVTRALAREVLEVDTKADDLFD
ncbi:MAG TPA: chromosomal replication initiator DnaA [Caulobacteraceae bacterium]|nr:chromosomal replication initiator DnaA [Caulobacteraceae bacterium]